jgi:hypothetical protein
MARKIKDAEDGKQQIEESLQSTLVRCRELEHRAVTLESAERTRNDSSEIQLQTIKSQLRQTRTECDKRIEQITIERDDAVLEVNRLTNRMSSVDSIRHEYELDKAKMDLAYRKRIGEMESEVRRTEIESVRLRKQILSLTQRIEAYEQISRRNGGGSYLDDIRRSRIFAIETGTPATGGALSGRITRLTFATHEEDDEPRIVTPAVVELSQ